MKFLFFLTLIFWAFSFSAFAARESPHNTEFFEAAKIYQDKDYALNDVVEFAIFDMSEVKFINESDETTLKKTKENLAKLPKSFYQNLKNEVISQSVPVTLYPSNAPAHTKPLALSIKIKSLHLKTTAVDGTEPPTQSVTMRIFGQIVDKKTGEALIKFYDSGSDVIVSPSENVSIIYDKISAKMMKNLALFLKSKY